MATLKVRGVQVTTPLGGGPDEVVVLVETDQGKVVDFFVEVPRGGGRQYAKDLGVDQFDAIEVTKEQRKRAEVTRTTIDAATLAKKNGTDVVRGTDVGAMAMAEVKG